MTPERTLARPFSRAGIALRSGAEVRLEARPAAAGSGRVFVRDGVRIPATVHHVVDTTLATTLGVDGATVSLVEHLCAALYAAGVDNAEIHVEGPEVPVLDGSARGWVEAIAEAGVVVQDRPRRVLRVRAPIEVQAGLSHARVEPADGFHLDLEIDFAHPSIGRQRWAGGLDAFADELAWARTFGFLRDAEAVRHIARGVSLANTVVYDEGHGVLNPEGLRHDEEAVRHKALDTVGDLALLGCAIEGRLRAVRPGHTLHVALLRQLVHDAGETP